MSGTIKYEVDKRGIGSYRIRKYFNDTHDPIFNCIIENDKDAVAKSDAEMCCAALNSAEEGRTVRAKHPVKQAKVAIDYGANHCPRCGYFLNAG
jgi:hypothetical protein